MISSLGAHLIRDTVHYGHILTILAGVLLKLYPSEKMLVNFQLISDLGDFTDSMCIFSDKLLANSIPY